MKREFSAGREFACARFEFSRISFTLVIVAEETYSSEAARILTQLSHNTEVYICAACSPRVCVGRNAVPQKLASPNLASAADALQMMQQAFGGSRALVADLSNADKSKAWDEVYECLKQFEGSRGFDAEFEFVIGSGAKPT
jgi:hypothetical protein